MDNDEIQPQIPEDNKRKSRIQLGIQRTVQTAQFESIVIHYHIDEEITWASPTERGQKLENWKTLLTADFKKTFDQVLVELDLAHKCAYFKESSPAKKSTENLGKFDDLDSIG